MWQLYALGSLLVSAGENVIDKIALMQRGPIDSSIATFHRSFLFFLATVVIGLVGGPENLKLSFHWSILLFTPFGVLSSFFYTYLLRRIEVTSIGAAAYLAPFGFLLIDTNVVHVHLKVIQIIGMALLALGAMGFSMDGESHSIKREITLAVCGIFMFNIVYIGGEAYLFKYLNSTYGLNGSSFFASLWFVCTFALFLIVTAQGKLRFLIDRRAMGYLPRVLASKFCDALSAFLWAGALTMATVSQVNAFEALSPLALLVVTGVAQELVGFSLKEDLDGGRFVWKSGTVFLLILGGFLAR